MHTMASVRAGLNSNRADSAGLLAAGIAVIIIGWLWFPYRVLLIAGAVVTVFGGASLAGSLRRGRAWHQQDILIRELWGAAKAVPSGYVLTDPDTGELLTVERERGWLTLAVTDPPAPGIPTVVTRYPLGQWAAPNPPPLYRHLGALGDVPPARWRWQQRAVLERLNSQAHGLEVTADELAALTSQLARSAALA